MQCIECRSGSNVSFFCSFIRKKENKWTIVCLCKDLFFNHILPSVWQQLYVHSIVLHYKKSIFIWFFFPAIPFYAFLPLNKSQCIQWNLLSRKSIKDGYVIYVKDQAYWMIFFHYNILNYFYYKLQEVASFPTKNFHLHST